MKMRFKQPVFILLIAVCVGCITPVFAQEDGDGVGQTIEIHTRLSAFVGQPSWLLVIRDIDHNQNIPYLFNVSKGDNVWLAFTFGRDYLITVSQLQISTYQPWYNTYKHFKTHDFCHLESYGRIQHSTSLRIDIEGNLSPDSDTYTCHIMQFQDPNFYIAH